MPIDFYTFNTPNGRKISVALEEMALPYKVHVVNITKEQQYEPAFLNLSPNNKIPAIVDPDGPGGSPLSIFESGAILLYLAEHQYFADEVSVADFAIVGWAWRHQRHKVDLADYPHVKRWYEAMMARPGTKRGFEVALS